jgi:hypothetical protein
MASQKNTYGSTAGAPNQGHDEADLNIQEVVIILEKQYLLK